MNEVNSWKSLRHEYRRLKQAAHLAGKAKRGWSWWRFVLRLRAALSADEAIREESWPDENYRQLVLAEEPSQVDVVLAAHDDPEHGPPAREPMIFHCWMVYDPAYDSCSTIASLRSQVYPRWVLHMIDSTGKLPPTIKLYSRLNARMTISSGSPHPIQSRSCWHLFLEPGDRLPRWSLLELARSATRHPEAACLYGDHDEWRPGIGRRANPVLKPGWSPARLLAEPYPGRAIALRDDLVPATWKQSGASAWAAEAALIAHKQKATVIRLQRILLHIRPGQPNGFDDPSWFSAMLDRQPERKPDPEPAVSIVIPGWRSHCWLEQTLHHIMTSMAQVTREILIGGQSFPVGANRVKQSGHIPPVRFIAHSRPASLFTLVDACAGDYVLFLTDHFQSASPDWLSILMNGIGDDDVVGACPLVLFADHLVCAAGRGFGIDHITGFWNTNQSPEHHDPVRPHDLPGDVSILPEEAALYKRSFLIDHRDLLEGYRNGSAFHAAAGLAAIRHRQRMVFLPAASIVLGLAARDYGRSMCIRDARRLVSDIRASGLKQDPHAHAWIYHENGRSRLRRPEDVRHEDRLRSQMQAIDDVFTSQPRLDVFNRNAMDLFFAESGFDDRCPVADANAASSSDEGAALYVIATLLDPEVHQRYPRALTQSDGGGFWAWLEQQPALNDTAIARLRKLRRQDPAERIKHLYASRTDVRWLHPLAFTSAGERRFAQWLFAFGRDQANIDEGAIWWHLMAGAEDRSSGLKYSYAVHPDWQEDLGRQGTTAPSCREIAAWIQNTFNLSPDVPEEPSTPGHARNAWVNPVLPTRRGVNVLGVFTFPSGLQQATQTCAKALQSIPRPVARRDVMIAGKAPAEARGPFLDVNTHPVTVMVLPPLASRDTWFERAQLTWRQEQYTIGNWYTETANISDEIKRYALD